MNNTEEEAQMARKTPVETLRNSKFEFRIFRGYDRLNPDCRGWEVESVEIFNIEGARPVFVKRAGSRLKTGVGKQVASSMLAHPAWN